ncbi:MAG TPA: tetratricopeptide repeat protein [Patescibacteria group bacterium]|nr:tetratricopeptide repeat protein [Patescibacteria group bacterium]
MWNVIGIVLVGAGAVLIWSVLVKKFPQLKLIDLSTMAKERHAEVKSRIMKDRFERSLGAIAGKTATVTAKASGRVKGLYERAYGSLKKMEAKMDGGKAAAAKAAPVPDAAAGLAEAQKACQEERYEDAERMYIELLKHDAKHVDAYRGLAELYIVQKLYDQAAETLEFLLRLTGDDDRALGRLGQVEASRGNFQEAEARYLRSIELSSNATAYRADLGRVYLAAGEAKKAQEQFRTALQAEPHHPKYLDYFLEASILVGDPDSAREALGALEEVNPENAKLEDFRARIDAMLERA